MAEVGVQEKHLLLIAMNVVLNAECGNRIGVTRGKTLGSPNSGNTCHVNDTMMLVMVMVKIRVYFPHLGIKGIQLSATFPLRWIFKYCLQLLKGVKILSQTMDIKGHALIFYLGGT